MNCTTEKFINRFDFIEKSAMNLNKKLEDMTLEEMDEFWNQAKNNKIVEGNLSKSRTFITKIEVYIINIFRR